MKTICLVMRVGNDEQILESSLLSVKDWIHRYFIVDDASNDGSLKIVDRVLKGIEGCICKHPCSSKAEMIRLARAHGDYLLLMASDEQLRVQEPFGFGTLESDGYFAVVRQNGSDWRKPFLLRSELDW